MMNNVVESVGSQFEVKKAQKNETNNKENQEL